MHLRFFPAFFDHPRHIRFAHQETDEQIDLLLRQHPITTVPWIFWSLLAAFLPIVLMRLPQFLLLNFNLQIPNDISLALIILWYMLVFAYVIEKFLHWYFNIYIVTNKHLVDIEFSNLLQSHTTEVRLDDVQSAKHIYAGVFGSLFRYGDVIVETAAERQQIQFLKVPKPDVVKDRIQDLQELEEGGPDVT